ncbi:MAG: SgcJ/EcaC family oxidoreductase [Sphingobacteriales bacterium]|nr:MAG: SgcJ/EcaC family oxidoreductase [Sphingobacteriales bacterium]
MNTETSTIEQLYFNYLTAWNNRDGKAMAAFFAADGNLIGFDGSQVNGAEEIDEHLSSIFADHKPASYVGIVQEARQLNDDTTLLRAIAGMLPPGSNTIKPELNTIHTLVAVNEGGWKIALFQATPAALHGRPGAVKAMTEELQAQVKH